MNSIADNLAAIRAQMAAACERVGRDPAGVQLIGVTKTVSLERMREGVESGITVLGENYIQEAREKIESLADLKVSWHFIGHLQSNKAKLAAQWFDCIHTLDRERLARELDRQAHKQGRRIEVLIEVNVGHEESKSGVSPDSLIPLFQAVAPYEGLVVRGLMALPPYLADPEQVRPYLRRLRQLLDRLRESSAAPERLTELSMGMSHDFQVAIEEGATMIRIGTALFGARPPRNG